MDKAIYSVWVGGIEVNDHYLTRAGAVALAEKYSEDGYTDVAITFSVEIL